jgi:RimJ/RimL family protein N-acetyltransferase
MSHFQHLNTPRFQLRDFTPNDEIALSAYQSDPRYAEFYPPELFSRENTARLVQLFIEWANETPRRNYQLAVTRKNEPNQLIGCAGLRGEGYTDGVAEFGMELSPVVWGRYRYAIEIAEAVLEFGFAELKLNEIRGVTIDANSRIARLAEHYGFEVMEADKTASIEENKWLWARGWSQTCWRLTRKQWEICR